MPGMDQSYADMLTMPNDATEEMYQALFDIDKDGDVDADDKAASGASDVNFGEGYNTVENFKKFRKAMLDPNNKAAKDIFANKVVESMADGYQSGVDATQAQADADLQTYQTKQDILAGRQMDVARGKSAIKIEEMEVSAELKKEYQEVVNSHKEQREKNKNKTFKLYQNDESPSSVTSEQIYNVVDKINYAIMTPSPGNVGKVMTLGKISFYFDKDYNIRAAQEMNDDGTYSYNLTFSGDKRNEFFSNYLGINEGEYGLVNFK